MVALRLLSIVLATILVASLAAPARAGTTYTGSLIAGSPTEVLADACQLQAMEGVSSNCVTLATDAAGQRIADVNFDRELLVVYTLCFYDAMGNYVDCGIEGDTVPGGAAKMAVSVPVGAPFGTGRITWTVQLEPIV